MTFGAGKGDPPELGWERASQDGSTSLNVSRLCTPSQLAVSQLIELGDKLQYTQCEVSMPYLPASSFRDGVRQLAISKGGNEARKSYRWVTSY